MSRASGKWVSVKIDKEVPFRWVSVKTDKEVPFRLVSVKTDKEVPFRWVSVKTDKEVPFRWVSVKTDKEVPFRAGLTVLYLFLITCPQGTCLTVNNYIYSMIINTKVTMGWFLFDVCQSTVYS